MNHRSSLRSSSSARFDPFNDRRSRDIRNHLSGAFIQALKIPDSALFENVAQTICVAEQKGMYHRYVNERLKIYRQAFNCILSLKITDALEQATVLWNLRLFFEVHELLEALWMPAEGQLRRALKGLIQAAGVYVHLEQGNGKAAAGLAERAAAHLGAAGERLAMIGGIPELIEKLRRIDPEPPRLRRCRDYENE